MRCGVAPLLSYGGTSNCSQVQQLSRDVTGGRVKHKTRQVQPETRYWPRSFVAWPDGPFRSTSLESVSPAAVPLTKCTVWILVNPFRYARGINTIPGQTASKDATSCRARAIDRVDEMVVTHRSGKQAFCEQRPSSVPRSDIACDKQHFGHYVHYESLGLPCTGIANRSYSSVQLNSFVYIPSNFLFPFPIIVPFFSSLSFPLDLFFFF